MSRERTSRTAFAMLALALCLGGCERGCLARRLGGGGAPEGAGGAAPQGKTRTLDLSGTDCSDGLLRCVEGRVEASRAAHLPYPCGEKTSERQAACACPWDVVASCPSGCASDGLEVIGPPTDAGTAQLCRPDAIVARPLLPGDPIPSEICTQEGVACVDGIVRTCEAPGLPVHALATCLNGCQSHVGIDDVDPGALKNLDGLVAILCQRGHAERR